MVALAAASASSRSSRLAVTDSENDISSGTAVASPDAVIRTKRCGSCPVAGSGSVEADRGSADVTLAAEEVRRHQPQQHQCRQEQALHTHRHVAVHVGPFRRRGARWDGGRSRRVPQVRVATSPARLRNASGDDSGRPRAEQPAQRLESSPAGRRGREPLDEQRQHHAVRRGDRHEQRDREPDRLEQREVHPVRVHDQRPTGSPAPSATECQPPPRRPERQVPGERIDDAPEGPEERHRRRAGSGCRRA